MKPELGRVVGFASSFINSINIEFPVACVNRALNRYSIAYFPAEPLSGSFAHDRTLPIVHKHFPLIIRHGIFRIHLPPALWLDGELRKEVFFFLINSPEPCGMRNLFDARDGADAAGVCAWQRLNESNAVHDD